MSNRWLFACAFLLALLPLFVDQAITRRGAHYDDLIGRYERFCLDKPCEVDFDGDGRPGLLSVERQSPPRAGYDSWLVASDGGRELLRLPHWYSDGTFRTHVAIWNNAAETHLVLYDGAHAPPDSAPPTETVFVWDGRQLVERQPSAFDREILSALAARDDAGTFNHWVMYDFMRLPALAVYYLLLVGAVWWLALRHRRHPRGVINHLT